MFKTILTFAITKFVRRRSINHFLLFCPCNSDVSHNIGKLRVTINIYEISFRCNSVALNTLLKFAYIIIKTANTITVLMPFRIVRHAAQPSTSAQLMFTVT